MKKISRILFIMMAILIGCGTGYAQDKEKKKPQKKKERPVRSMFDSGIMIDDQTSITPVAKTLEFDIQHRFGLIKTNGLSDLFGIYAPSSNTRMGINYSILDNLVVGYGITRLNMYSDFQVKWTFLRQSRSGRIPLNLSFYGNMAIDGRNESEFGEDYEFINRLSYFGQLMVGRKFAEWFSIELSVSYSHYNAVPTDSLNYSGYDHDVLGVGGHMRFKFSPQSSIMIMYTMPVYIGGISDNEVTLNKFLPNFGFGYEISTSTHDFQIFVTTSNGLIPQNIYMNNTSDWTKGEFRFGFNITRLWSF